MEEKKDTKESAKEFLENLEKRAEHIKSEGVTVKDLEKLLGKPEDFKFAFNKTKRDKLLKEDAKKEAIALSKALNKNSISKDVESLLERVDKLEKTMVSFQNVFVAFANLVDAVKSVETQEENDIENFNKDKERMMYLAFGKKN